LSTRAAQRPIASEGEAVPEAPAVNDWEWTLNWGEVRPEIVIGSCPMTIVDIDTIRRETGATALLSLQTDQCREHFGIDYESQQTRGRQCGLAMINAPMLDFDPPDQRRRLPEAVHHLRELLVGGHRIYIHCTAGLNRGPLAVLGYLTFVELMSPSAAILAICAGRPEAAPSWEAYYACREDLTEALRERIRVRAFYLSQEYPSNDPGDNWLQAERESIRDLFVLGQSRQRLDPARSAV
jgi:atypical dual specificity phosphatase